MTIQRHFPDTPEARRRTMRAIRSYGNRTTESRLRSSLVSRRTGGWILHTRELIGRPDFYFEAERLAIFVDGCFWHGCPNCGHVPKTNQSYWDDKFKKNRIRDEKVSRKLRSSGISVLRFWECQVRHDLSGCVKNIQRRLSSRRDAPSS